MPNRDDADLAFTHAVVDVVANALDKKSPEWPAATRAHRGPTQRLAKNQIKRVANVVVEGGGRFVSVAEPPTARGFEITTSAKGYNELPRRHCC
jgi:hypothetical protein